MLWLPPEFTPQSSTVKVIQMVFGLGTSRVVTIGTEIFASDSVVVLKPSGSIFTIVHDEELRELVREAKEMRRQR